MPAKSKEPNPPRAKTQKLLAVKMKRERQRKKSKLSEASRKKGGGEVSLEEVDTAMLKAHLDTMAMNLPGKNRRSMPVVPQNAFPRQWRTFPYPQQRREVGWLSDGVAFADPSIDGNGEGKMSTPLARVLIMKYLHREIQQFAGYVQLSANETAQREGVLGELHDAITSKWPSVTVSAFGSYASGLSIFESDLDVTVEGLGIYVDDNGKHASSPIKSPSPSEAAKQGVCVLSSEGSMNNLAAMGAEAESKEDSEGDVSFSIDRGGSRPQSKRSSSSGSISHGVIDLTESPPTSSEAHGEQEDKDERTRMKLKRKRRQHGDSSEGGDSEGGGFFLYPDSDSSASSCASTPPYTDYGNHSGDDWTEDEREEKGGGGDDIMSRKGEMVTGRIVTSSSFSSADHKASQAGSGVVRVRYEGKAGASGGASDIDCGILVRGDTTVTSSGSGGSSGSRSSSGGGASTTTASGSSNSSAQVLRLTNGAVVEVDGRYATNVGMLLMKKEKGAGRVQSEVEAKERSVKHLKGLHSFLQSLGWVEASECRARAKVPIIALRHRSGIEVDISLGVSAHTHSEVVLDLVQAVGRSSFVPLSRVLKVFLGLVGADKPFNGGIGSFKLYVMIAHIYTNVAGQSTSSGVVAKDDPDVGLAYLLRLFFQYYGSPRNLNKGTTIQVRGAIVTFDTTSVISMSQLFRAAGEALDAAIARQAVVMSSPSPYISSNSHHHNRGRGGEKEFPGLLSAIVNAASLGARRVRGSSKGDAYFGIRAAPKVEKEGVTSSSSAAIAEGPHNANMVLLGQMRDRKEKLFPRLLLRLHEQVCLSRGLTTKIGTGNAAIDTVFRALQSLQEADIIVALQQIFTTSPLVAARVSSHCLVDPSVNSHFSSSSSSSSSSSGGRGGGGGSRDDLSNNTNKRRKFGGGGGRDSGDRHRKKEGGKYPAGMTGKSIKQFEDAYMKRTKKNRFG